MAEVSCVTDKQKNGDLSFVKFNFAPIFNLNFIILLI